MALTEDQSQYFSDEDITQYTSGNTDVTDVLVNNLNGIFGIPYQFLESVDPRLSATSVGSIYAERIISKMPLLFLTPCLAEFMPGYNKNDRSTVLSGLFGGDFGSLASSLEGKGRYYTTRFSYKEYIQYVNTMWSQLCISAGEGNTRINTPSGKKKLKNIDWNTMRNDSFKSYFNAYSSPVFYVDGLNSISESFSNSTTESSLASSINGFSDQANELRFLLGNKSVVSQLAQTATDLTEGITGALQNVNNVLTGGMLSDLASTGASKIISGAKISFPKIWQDSSFSRSYSFDIKLRSPDNDTLSILLNIMAPLMHLLPMVLPRGYSKDNDAPDPNTYESPFLCKAYCKGMFNIDMGIITDMTVSKGAECQWNDDGLPTQIDISISIEDLYSHMFMTKLASENKTFSGLITSIKDAAAVVNNTAMMDYIANLVGLNIADVEMLRQVKMLGYLAPASASRAPSNLWGTFDQAIHNKIRSLFK